MPDIPSLAPGTQILYLPPGAASGADGIPALVVAVQTQVGDGTPEVVLAYVDPDGADSDTPHGRRILYATEVGGEDSPTYPVTAEVGSFTGAPPIV